MPTGLPPIGAEIPMAFLGTNTSVTIEGKLVSVDFRGGLKQRVDVDPDDPHNSVRLRVVGFKASAELPGESDGEGGSITLDQNDVDIDSKSRLRHIQQSPPVYEHVNLLSFTATIEKPGADPMVLVTAAPAIFLGHITQFPPGSGLYQLQSPVTLNHFDDLDTTGATIEKFPVKIGGL